MIIVASLAGVQDLENQVVRRRRPNDGRQVGIDRPDRKGIIAGLRRGACPDECQRGSAQEPQVIFHFWRQARGMACEQSVGGAEKDQGVQQGRAARSA